MKSSRQLSRLSITGHIHEHTPICVLIEIADAHGIKYDQQDHESPNFAHRLIGSIHKTPVPFIGEIKELAEWQCIARFVNKHSQWPQSKLIQAYNFLIGFINNEDPLIRIPEDFIYGTQTPINTVAINACILYKTCVHHRLNINSRTTINQMAYAVRMLRENVESVHRRAKIFIERDANRIGLINALMLFPYEIQDPESQMVVENIDPVIVPASAASHEMLQVLHNSLNNIRELQQKIDPTTHCGSIALAAINYGIDISKSRDPTREYKILRIAGRNDYRPGDPWMNYWYERNPPIFDLLVTFNPLFPLSYYDINTIATMVQNEGFSPNEIATSAPYELMQLGYVTETFYMGEMPNMKSMQTPINMDEIGEVPYGELLCYGQLNLPLQPISIAELISLFNSNQNFTNPFDANSVFSTTSINKLKLLLQSLNGPIPSMRLSQETIINRNQLIDSINGIEIITRSTDEPTRHFAFTYRNVAPDTKIAITTALTNLLHTGMYMRGWEGPGHEYPVIKAPVPPGREFQVAVNVTNSIAEYEKTCRSLGKIGTELNNLPLVKCRDRQYQVSNSNEDGLTIGDRVNIVKLGENTQNIASCIRLSSNWICASAHKYITVLGQSPPFDLFNLRHIS